MELNSKIYVAGHTGLVGSAVVRELKHKGYANIYTATHKEVDLRSQLAVAEFLDGVLPDYVIICAGTVGGIVANNERRAEFIYNNLIMNANIINSSYRRRVKKLIAIGSSCIYPRNCPQPIKEEYLLTGELEPTNEPYAIAKIATIKLCESYRRQYGCNFISAMPTNCYGEHDNYDSVSSHVLPALIKTIHEAKSDKSAAATIWGTGTVRREFIHSDDMAEAIVFLMNNYDGEQHINIGTGEEITIQDLAYMIKEIIGYTGEINNDLSKPDGMKRKLLDVSKINNLGWKARISLREGIEVTYKNYIK